MLKLLSLLIQLGALFNMMLLWYELDLHNKRKFVFSLY